MSHIAVASTEVVSFESLDSLDPGMDYYYDEPCISSAWIYYFIIFVLCFLQIRILTINWINSTVSSRPDMITLYLSPCINKYIKSKKNYSIIEFSIKCGSEPRVWDQRWLMFQLMLG